MANVDSALLRVEVVYAMPRRQRLIALSVAPGATVAGTIEASGILREFPEIDLAVNRVGIFGLLARPDELVQNGDRVEIYRPLQVDPKEARRKRALKSKRAVAKEPLNKSEILFFAAKTQRAQRFFSIKPHKTVIFVQACFPQIFFAYFASLRQTIVNQTFPKRV